MIALICLLVPPLLLAYLRELIFKNHESIYKSALTYAFSLLFLNGAMMLLLYYVFDSSGNLFYKLNNYSNFACKYIAASVVLAAAVPFAEKFFKERVLIDIKGPRHPISFQHGRALAIVYAVILFSLNFIRIFDNNFWGDEAYTTNLVMKSVSEIIQTTAADVHPPLYYLIVKIGYALFGNQGWMFHLVSLIPCGVILILSLTIIWKNLGKETAFVLMTLATLSSNAIKYNVEVRMYSWGALFVLLSFYALYMILTDEHNRSYILFTVFSLAAAYTHYYCLVSVAFFYLVILFLAIFKKRLKLKKVLLTCVCTVLGYLPWFFIMLNSLLERTDSYWITSIPDFKSSMEYLFSSQFSGIVWIGICAILIVVFFYETGIIRIKALENRKYKVSLNLTFTDIHFSTDLTWIIAGIISIIGTIIFAIVLSEAVRPFYTLRYIYPVSILAWLILGKLISKLKLKKVVTVILAAYMLVTFLPAYAQTYTNEKNANESLQETLEATVDEIRSEDTILSNHSHIAWTIAPYYYPGVGSQLVELSDLPELDTDTCYWLIISGKQEMDEVFQQLAEQGFTWTQIVDAGNLGTHTVYIYQIIYSEIGGVS